MCKNLNLKKESNQTCIFLHILPLWSVLIGTQKIIDEASKDITDYIFFKGFNYYLHYLDCYFYLKV